MIVPMKRVGGSGSAAAIRSRRGPECLGVRASWPPVVALVVMNERPAPRCKRGRYKWSLRARPIRMSTGAMLVCMFLACIRSRNRERKSFRHGTALAAFYRLSNGIY
jgi:hypothetical protein